MLSFKEELATFKGRHDDKSYKLLSTHNDGACVGGVLQNSHQEAAQPLAALQVTTQIKQATSFSEKTKQLNPLKTSF